MSDLLEVYTEYEGALRLIASAPSSLTPEREEAINIKGAWYRVTKRSYTIDYSGERHVQACCSIVVEPITA